MSNKILTVLITISVVFNLCGAHNGLKKPKRSLGIVFDVTGSMSDEINALRKGVLILLDSFKNQPDNPIANYIFIQFRDEIADPDIIPPVVEDSYDKIVKSLNSFRINDRHNPDCPESCFNGIKRGLDLANDDSIFFVFTDAGTKHKELEPEIMRLVQKKRITFYFFLTSGCDRADFGNDYRNLATSSNGLVFEVDYTAIEKHFPNYRDVINDKLGLQERFTGPAGKSKIGIDVDSSMKEFTFTIVAQRPLITILDPSRNKLAAGSYQILTDLPTIKMIKVKDPQAGQWTVEVETSSAYTGQIAVLSDLTFKYGFAVNEPNSISETSFSPLLGQINLLAILPSDPSLIGNLEYVILDAKSQKYTHKLRKKTVAEGDLYITEKFHLPNKPFKVSLHGTDPLNLAIKRLLSPDIAGRSPDKPDTAIVPKINEQEGAPIYLICQVDSMIDIEISWFKVGQSVALKTLHSKQSNKLNYTIEESEISDSGTYTCVAKNSAGQSESLTVVDVRRTLLNVNTPIKEHFQKVGVRSVVLKCVVAPGTKSVKVSWLFNGSPDLPRGSILNLPNLILNNIDRSFNGTYTCVGQRQSEIMRDNIIFHVQYPARVLNLFNLNPYSLLDTSKPIELFGQSDLKVICGHEGYPEATVKWVNKNGVVVSPKAILTVNGTDINEAGDYICQVENLLGKDEQRIRVTITIKPKLLQNYVQHHSVKLGDKFELECPLEIIPSNKMDIIWYQVTGSQLIGKITVEYNKPFKFQNKTTQLPQTFTTGNRLLIPKIEHSTNGEYTCRASNKAGVIEAELAINVLYKPSILKIDKLDDKGQLVDQNINKLNIINSKIYSLICHANGNPTADVKWINKKGVVVSATPILTVNGNDINEAGDYICQVENTLGKDEQRIQVDITIKPKLLQNYVKSHSVKFGDQFELECPLDIIPNNKLDIIWYQNTTQLSQVFIADNRLRIPKIDHSSNGKYKCKVSNNAGAIEADFAIDVLYNPTILKIDKLNDKGQLEDPSVTKLDIFTGNIYTLNCHANGNPKAETRWINGNGDVLSRTPVLVVNGNDIRHAGDRICQVENPFGKDEKKVDIDITIKPELLKNYKKEQRVNLGDSFELACPLNLMLNNKMNIIWFQNGTRIPPNLIRADRLILPRIVHSSKGTYKCEANNKAGFIEADFTLDVLYEPTILKITKFDDKGFEVVDPHVTKLEIFNTSVFSLNCQVNGNPPPQTVWKRNGKIFVNNHKLEINTVKSGFSGIYECFTQNELDMDERALSIKEIIKPKLVAEYSKLYKLIENREFRMICPVEAGDYDITWYLNKKNIDHFKQSDGTLYISQALIHMTGEAYCIASNKAGTVVATFNFEVLRSPHGLITLTTSYKNRIQQISPDLKRMTLVKNEPFDLTCNAEGNPAPRIFWTNQKHRIFNNAAINIQSIQPADAGNYTCIAINAIGEQKENIEIVVYVPPYLLDSSGFEEAIGQNNVSQTVLTVLNWIQVPSTYFRKVNYEQIVNSKEGENIVLNCRMAGNPNPKVYWFKNNEILNQLEPVVEFPSATVSDSGIYKCFGENAYGKMVAIFYVNVQKPISIISATSSKSVYELNEEIRFNCKTEGNQLPVILWRANGIGPDNENIFKTKNTTIKNHVLQQNGPIFLNQKKISQPNDVNSLDRYGKMSYEFINGEYIGTLEYIIRAAQFTDDGNYTCIARLRGDRNSAIKKTVQVEVVRAPYLEPADTEYNILEDIDAYKIKCPINGHPIPMFDWYRGTNKLTSNEYFNIQNIHLEVRKPMFHHTGEYACRGTNNGGTVEFKFKINIFKHLADISKVVLNRSNKQRVEVKKGETKELTCPTAQRPIYWSKIIDSYPDKKRQLIIVNQTYNIYGDVFQTIMCSKDAEPEYGEIFNIVVLEQPSIEPTDRDIEVKLDDVLKLKCITVGEPAPSLKWFKYEGSQRHDIANFKEFEVRDGLLIKHRAENSDTAQYGCIARNSEGMDTRIYNVTVLNDSHYFSPWTISACSQTCGEGVRIKTRDCVHTSCNKEQQRVEEKCIEIQCPVDGGWSSFSKSSECSKTCVLTFAEDSVRESRRQCNNPTPAFGGHQCIGKEVKIEKCKVPLCESTFGKSLDYSGCKNDEAICCPNGFVYDTAKSGCLEIDKCQRKGPNTVCHVSTECKNVGVDDYECNCKPGYREPFNRANKPMAKNLRCVDINECKEKTPCGSLRCINKSGSYQCV